MAWQKGQSGNPKGRPPAGSAVAEAIRKLAGQDGKKLVAVLMAISQDTDASAADRIRACDILLDRGYGRVPLAAPDQSDSSKPTRVIYEYPPTT